MSRKSRTLTALWRSGRRCRSSQPALRAVPAMVPSRSSSSVRHPARAKRRKRRSATLMLRVPSSTLVVEVAVLALFPDLDRRAVLAPRRRCGFLPGGAAVPEGRGAAGADPLVATRVTLLLLGQALLEGLHQLVPAELFELRAFGVGQMFFRRLPQPFFGNQHVHSRQGLDALEVLAESAVILVEIALVLDQDRPREDVEVVDTMFDDMLLQCLEQGKELLDRDWQPARLEVEEEVDQHRRFRW
jgi:hypothetical protein